MTAAIRLKTRALAKHMTSAGKNQASLASDMGMAHTTLGRIIRGIQAPGEKFIAGLLAAFPHLDFDDLFEVVVEERETA